MKRPEKKIRNDHEAAIWDYIDHQEGIIAELVEAASIFAETDFSYHSMYKSTQKELQTAIQKAKEATK